MEILLQTDNTLKEKLLDMNMYDTKSTDNLAINNDDCGRAKPK